MRYEERSPAAHLRPFIECVWRIDDPSPAGAPQRILPDGCVEIVIHAGSRFLQALGPGPATLQPPALVVSSMSRHLLIQAAGPVRTWGIRFRPGGAYPFFGVPVHELADRTLALDALWGAGAAHLLEDLAGASTWSEGLATIDRALDARRGRGRASSPAVARAVGRLLAREGRLGVEDLARWTGWSRRHLERRFREEVGVPPKVLARVARLNAVLRRRGAEAEPDWVTLALDAGFADQSHLIRDFVELAGATPSRLDAGAGELGALFTAPERLDAYFGSAGAGQ